MQYEYVEICATCKGVINIPESQLSKQDYICQCDWWEDTAPLDADADDGQQTKL